MGLHHLAFATRDAEATREFYEDVLGYRLLRTEAHLHGEGWFKHLFFDIGDGECIAFFEFENVGESADWRTDHSLSLGVPPWVNHVAMRADSLAELEVRRKSLVEARLENVTEIDHGWCRSVYAMDPNAILLEWCCTTAAFEQPREEALRLLREPVSAQGESSRKDRSTL